MPEHLRADARRNYARVLAVAEREVAVHGAGASLEQIARVAGVGSATVRRHFPTRRALLEAVSATRIEALCRRACDLADDDDSRKALLDWHGEVLDYCVTARGLAVALCYDSAESDPVQGNSCAGALVEAGEPLLRRAVRDGTVDPTATVSDLITLAVGIVLATENGPDAATRARRLFQVEVTGLGPRAASPAEVDGGE